MSVKTYQETVLKINRHSREGGNPVLFDQSGSYRRDGRWIAFFKRFLRDIESKRFLICYTIILITVITLFGCSTAWAVPKFDEAEFAPISGIVEQAVYDGRIPGAVVLIGTDEKILYRKVFGWRSLRPEKTPMMEDVIFDVASLTKVIATTTAVMQLVEKGSLNLDAPVAKYWPAFKKYGKGKITLRHLLTHYSGLRVEPRLKAERGGKAILKAVASEKPLHPPGRVYSYSDLNFIILGEIVRRASGLSLERYCELYIFKPLAMKDTMFKPPQTLLGRIAPTQEIEGRILCGEVHDPIARRMGGVTGHAGLFSTAGDLAVFAQMMLKGGRARDKRILHPDTVEMMTMPQSPRGKEKPRGLGWDLYPPFAANRQDLAPLGAYGHLGYTGTGLWIDPVSKIFLIVLTNRVHAESGGNAGEVREDIKRQLSWAVGLLSNEDITRQRPALAPFVPKRDAASSGRTSPVLTGIDVLEKEKYAPLQGLSVGLVTNHTGRNAAGIRTIDLLYRASGVRLAALFSPEHGLNGTADQIVPSTRDARTGIFVHSLYGVNRRPVKETLDGLDALVFDIQDAGVRFYTYISTLHYAMEAAAEKGIPFFVLDRPNPINADTVQGPVSEDLERSFTSCFELPIRHGMTVGELARMFNAEDKIGADLRVIAMNGYKRSLWYDETGLLWINPSPNLRSLKAATLYPGVALIEGANVGVGRGTPNPFEMIGAPWISAGKLKKYLERRGISGVSFTVANFTPSSGIYRGRVCHGVRIRLTDRNKLDSSILGIEIAAALFRLYPKSFQLDQTYAMIGSQQVVDDIRAGKDPQAIAASWQDSLDQFNKMRAGYLLY